MSRLWRIIRGPTARRDSTPEERDVATVVVSKIMDLEHKVAELHKLTEREKTMQQAMQSMRKGAP